MATAGALCRNLAQISLKGRTMPTRERVQALIGLVEGGRYLEAIEAFYHDDASMQENLDPPRHGRGTLRAKGASSRRIARSAPGRCIPSWSRAIAP
jgi:hypothetical protein